MPLGTPREARSLHEAFADSNFFVREDGHPSRTRRESRHSQHAREAQIMAAMRRTAWYERESLSSQIRESLRPTLDDEPAASHQPPLVMNRATTLLACICLMRLQHPHWTDPFIAGLLTDSFPEFTIRAHDVHDLFHASCRNRPRWVIDMRDENDFQQRSMGLNLLELLLTNVLAHLPQLPQERYGDRREGIRYLQELVGGEVEDVYF